MDFLCNIPFWLLWLLPLLLLFWNWWSSNNKYNNMVADYDGRIGKLDGRISGLESDLSASVSTNNTLESDLALAKGRMREMEAEVKSLKAEVKGSGKGSGKGGGKGSSGGSSGSGSGSGGGSGSGSGASSGTGDIASSLGAAGAASLTGGGSGSGGSSSSSSGDGSGGSSGGKNVYGGLSQNNLQLIEGIGPKMESVLNEAGINSLSDLAGKSTSEIQAILDSHGDRYKIIDPGTWSQQAGLGAGNQWAELIDLQKRLDTGVDNAKGMTDSKLEKHLIKTGALKKWKQDDLTEIEGIGPATDKLLRENGINSWRDLANTTAENLKAILAAGGSRFSLGDPTTWPKQAELAADGEFDKLQEYQDFLDGGKA